MSYSPELLETSPAAPSKKTDLPLPPQIPHEQDFTQAIPSVHLKSIASNTKVLNCNLFPFVRTPKVSYTTFKKPKAAPSMMAPLPLLPDQSLDCVMQEAHDNGPRPRGTRLPVLRLRMRPSNSNGGSSDALLQSSRQEQDMNDASAFSTHRFRSLALQEDESPDKTETESDSETESELDEDDADRTTILPLPTKVLLPDMLDFPETNGRPRFTLAPRRSSPGLLSRMMTASLAA